MRKLEMEIENLKIEEKKKKKKGPPFYQQIKQQENLENQRTVICPFSQEPNNKCENQE